MPAVACTVSVLENLLSPVWSPMITATVTGLLKPFKEMVSYTQRVGHDSQ